MTQMNIKASGVTARGGFSLGLGNFATEINTNQFGLRFRGTGHRCTIWNEGPGQRVVQGSFSSLNRQSTRPKKKGVRSAASI